jgi:predicted MFS family arabinose efflux permease
VFIALGIAVGTWLTGKELARRGYDRALALGCAMILLLRHSGTGRKRPQSSGR